jgi:hypothetical protein
MHPVRYSLITSSSQMHAHQALVLYVCCVPEKVGVKQTGLNKK